MASNSKIQPDQKNTQVAAPRFDTYEEASAFKSDLLNGGGDEQYSKVKIVRKSDGYEVKLYKPIKAKEEPKDEENASKDTKRASKKGQKKQN